MQHLYNIENPLKVIDDLIHAISHDTYYFTYDDILSIESRLRSVQQFIQDLYKKRGKEFK